MILSLQTIARYLSSAAKEAFKVNWPNGCELTAETAEEMHELGIDLFALGKAMSDGDHSVTFVKRHSELVRVYVDDCYSACTRKSPAGQDRRLMYVQLQKELEYAEDIFRRELAGAFVVLMDFQLVATQVHRGMKAPEELCIRVEDGTQKLDLKPGDTVKILKPTNEQMTRLLMWKTHRLLEDHIGHTLRVSDKTSRNRDEVWLDRPKGPEAWWPRELCERVEPIRVGDMVKILKPTQEQMDRLRLNFDHGVKRRFGETLKVRKPSKDDGPEVVRVVFPEVSADDIGYWWPIELCEKMPGPSEVNVVTKNNNALTLDARKSLLDQMSAWGIAFPLESFLRPDDPSTP